MHSLTSTGTIGRDGDTFPGQMTLMVFLYFVIGFITAMNDILVPHFKDLFHLTNAEALTVQLVFFGAYFIVSVPSSWIVGGIGYKPSILVALVVIGSGLFLFIPASFAISYTLFVLALFVVGSGLALLQVTINPFVTALGPQRTAAARLNLVGGFNSIATTLAPHVGAVWIFVAAGAPASELARSVRIPYAILGALAFVMALATRLTPLPEILPIERERPSNGGPGVWRHPGLRLGAFAIFVYVGAEVAVGSMMISYLGQSSMGGMSHLRAAQYVSLYWGGAMIGRFVGYFVLRKTQTSRALCVVATAAFLLICVNLVGRPSAAMWALVFCGLFNSVMWPCIFPMALQGLGEQTSKGSGILVSMIVGGAVIPFVQAMLADRFGYRNSFCIELLCYGYIAWFGATSSGKRVAGEISPVEIL